MRVANVCAVTNDLATTRGRAGTAPQQNPEQMSDERVMTALHTMQDHLQQTTVMTQRRSRQMRPEHTVPKSKGDAAYDAMKAFHSSAATPGRCEVHLRLQV